MTLVRDALTWQGLVIGGQGGPYQLDEGIEGLGRVGVNPRSTPRAMGGSWGGVAFPGERRITAPVWLRADPGDDGGWDHTPFMDLYDAMEERPLPDDELPLQWAGLMWPDEHCVFARPTRCEALVDEEGVHGGAPGVELQWVASDPTVYSAEQTTARLWPTEDPVTSDDFYVANSGRRVPWARKAIDLRVTAHGTVTGLWVKVAHADGTFEKISFQGTMTGGQVLTVRDMVPRVGSALRSGWVRSTTETGGPSRAPRWWMLHHSDGLDPEDDGDGANRVTIGVATGSFSGFLKTRSTR